MYCQKCGKETQDGSRFCMHCGADLSGYKVEISPKIEVSPKISVSAKAEGYPRCPNCENVLTDRNKIFSCQLCGKKVCDTCGFHYNCLKLCEKCKTKKEEEDRRENLRREEERKKRQREEERKRKEEERKRSKIAARVAGIFCLFMGFYFASAIFWYEPGRYDPEGAEYVWTGLGIFMIILSPIFFKEN